MKKSNFQKKSKENESIAEMPLYSKWKPNTLSSYLIVNASIHAHLVTQSCLTLCNPAHQASVHGISQARILEWVAISTSRGSSWSRDWNITLLNIVFCNLFRSLVGRIQDWKPAEFVSGWILDHSLFPRYACYCLMALCWGSKIT